MVESLRRVFEVQIYIFSFLLLIGVLVVAIYLLRSNSVSGKNLVLPSLILVVSTVSTVMLFSMESLVHGTLYHHGLVFSEVWADEYRLLFRSMLGFNMLTIAFALGLIIKDRFASAVTLVHRVNKSSKKKKKKAQKKRKMPSLRRRTAEPQKDMDEIWNDEES